MAKDPAFLFYPGDYLRDTQCLSEKSQVAYDRIMCEHMRNICISKQQLNFFIKRLNDDEKNELMFLLTKKEEGYQIEWVAESIVKRRAYSESRRKNRLPKKKKDMKTYVKHMENENEIENIIKYLNEKARKNFSSKSDATIKLLNARLKDYSVEQIRSVIDKKCNDWLEDEKMQNYLRPETLFNINKFENYINESGGNGKVRLYTQADLISMQGNDVGYKWVKPDCYVKNEEYELYREQNER